MTFINKYCTLLHQPLGRSYLHATGIVLWMIVCAVPAQPAQELRISRITEKRIELEWDSVPEAIGYQVYTAKKPHQPIKNRTLLNQKLIESGNRFVFIWQFENGERFRAVKGYRHYLSVAAEFETAKGQLEGTLSNEVSNDYFDPYSHASTEKTIRNLLVPNQRTDTLPVKYLDNSADTFIAFMTGPGKVLYRTLQDSLDFRAVGACVPVSAIVVRLLDQWGIGAYRVEGTFIKEWHTFVIVGIDNSEYVLDFTADQFVPDVSPVLVPRDSCFLSSDGRLGANGDAVYEVARIYTAEQSRLVDREQTRIYESIYRRVQKGFPATHRPARHE